MRSAKLTMRIAVLSVAIGALGTAGGQTVNPPVPGPLRPYVFPNVEQFQLPNGMKVILDENHTLPVLEGRLILDAGAMR
jgi:hypothetical protein